jgi:hypothetical protein
MQDNDKTHTYTENHHKQGNQSQSPHTRYRYETKTVAKQTQKTSKVSKIIKNLFWPLAYDGRSVCHGCVYLHLAEYLLNPKEKTIRRQEKANKRQDNSTTKTT